MKGVPMNDFIPRTGRHAAASVPGPPPGNKTYQGVRGWLFVFCLMLTVAGPLISAWLIAYEFAEVAPSLADSAGLQAATFASIVLTACALAFGAYAGLRLWLIRPHAVATAKQALLLGLAVEIVTTLIDAVAASTLHADDGLFQPFIIGIVPGLAFFTLCFAYLNRSRRVHATYPPDADLAPQP
jgi:hypothetical protein